MAKGKWDMVKPVIGVTLSAKGSFLIWLMHKLAVTMAGGRAKKITAKSNSFQDVDAYVIGGGDDIGLNIEGATVNPVIKYDAERDALEIEVLRHAFKENKPVLGICRGAQMINLARGGSLYSDLSDYKKHLKRQRILLPRKTIRVDEDSMLYSVLQKQTLSINALHHQSVKDLGNELRVVARDDEGIVQAIECSDEGLLLGVQWHPELIPWSRSHRSFFSWLVKHADN